MSDFPNPRAIEAALKAHLMSKGRVNAFVNVQQIPGKKDVPIYIVTTESSLASLLEPFLEARMGRRCPYVQGSFLVHGEHAERLLG